MTIPEDPLQFQKNREEGILSAVESSGGKESNQRPAEEKGLTKSVKETRLAERRKKKGYHTTGRKKPRKGVAIHLEGGKRPHA